MPADLLILACTVCDNPGGASLRDALLEDAEIGRNLLAVVLPWVMCFGVVAVLHITRRRPEDRQ